MALKTENLQRTGSFKIRGALAKLGALGDTCATGVITASAGNHGQAVAYAARARGVRCEVYMPETAPIAKVEAARALGANIHLLGSTIDESLLAAHERAARLNTRVHQLEKRLSEALGEHTWRESGLGVPTDIDALHQRISQLEQHNLDLQQQLDERDDDLAAARAANRELMARLNTPNRPR